ncbi:MAG: hypothetical protein ACREQ5_24790, partial [Candidatus Dormibacteria bacterium]
PIPVPESSKPSTPAVDPVFLEWQKDNTWYSDKNQDLMDYANAVGIRLHREQPSLVGDAFLTKITSTVKKAFPDKFGSRRSDPNSVEGGGNDNFSTSSSSSSRSTTLPADARSEMKRLSKEDWYMDLAKSQKLTPEQMYMRDYNG